MNTWTAIQLEKINLSKLTHADQIFIRSSLKLSFPYTGHSNTRRWYDRHFIFSTLFAGNRNLFSLFSVGYLVITNDRSSTQVSGITGTRSPWSHGLLRGLNVLCTSDSAILKIRYDASLDTGIRLSRLLVHFSSLRTSAINVQVIISFTSKANISSSTKFGYAASSTNFETENPPTQFWH
jgi:hypothetical protein